MKKIRDFWEKYLGIAKKYFWFWIWWVLFLAHGRNVVFYLYYSTKNPITVLSSPFHDFIIMLLAVSNYFCLPVSFIGFTVCIWLMSRIALRKIMKKGQQEKDIKE
jgi:hypothetical protein